MTDPEPPEPPFHPGDILTNPIAGKRYEIVGVERHYLVRIGPDDPEAGETASEPTRYPEESLQHMIESGRLAGHHGPSESDQEPDGAEQDSS